MKDRGVVECLGQAIGKVQEYTQFILLFYCITCAIVYSCTTVGGWECTRTGGTHAIRRWFRCPGWGLVGHWHRRLDRRIQRCGCARPGCCGCCATAAAPKMQEPQNEWGGSAAEKLGLIWSWWEWWWWKEHLVKYNVDGLMQKYRHF